MLNGRIANALHRNIQISDVLLSSGDTEVIIFRLDRCRYSARHEIRVGIPIEPDDLACGASDIRVRLPIESPHRSNPITINPVQLPLVPTHRLF